MARQGGGFPCTEADRAVGPEHFSALLPSWGHHGLLVLSALLRQILHVWLEPPAPKHSPSLGLLVDSSKDQEKV